MSTEFNIPRDSTLGLIAGKLEEQNAILTAWATQAGATIPIEDWEAVQTIVRAGAAPAAFAIGDQLQCKRGTTTLTWDVIGFDHDVPVDPNHPHSMTLQLHDCINTFQYDAPEAMYYAVEALPAGTYHYTLGTVSEWQIGDGVTRQFTLTSAVPKGGQIRVNGDAGAATSQAYVYASATATTASETAAVTAGSGGAALDNLNHVHRIPYGSNNWRASALRQWLNSDGAAGAWWVPKSNYDRPPAAAASMAGFLNGLDADFKNVICPVTKRTALNTTNEGGGYNDTVDRVFLLSKSEAFYTLTNNIDEGTPYDYYKLFSDLSARGDGNDANRIKRVIGGTTPQWWWLRSPYPSCASGVYLAYTAGQLSSRYANISGGAAPACCIC